MSRLPPGRRRKASSEPSKALADAPDDDSALRHTGIRFMGMAHWTSLSKPFPGHQTLTPKERVALAQIIRGISSKEAARALGISPRTIDFHRANLLKKLDARNAADLVHKVLGE